MDDSAERLVVINWRNRATASELGGGNTRRLFLIGLIKELLSPREAVEVFVEDVDTPYSKALAAAGRALERLGARGLASVFRELRFGLASCDRLSKFAEGSAVVVDHARGLYMMHRCRLRPRLLIAILHDYHLEFPYGVNKYLSSLSRRFDKAIISALRDKVDLAIVVSERDRLLYSERLGGDKIAVFPNIYHPGVLIADEVKKAEDRLIINVVSPKGDYEELRKFMAKLRALTPAAEIRAFSSPSLPGVMNMGSIPDRVEYLKKLAEGHIGVNLSLAESQPGTNVKRYDYAIAGLVPFSYKNLVVGEPLPHEYGFTDVYDLAAKIAMLDIDTLIKYGKENSKFIYNIYLKYLNELKERIRKIIA